MIMKHLINSSGRAPPARGVSWRWERSSVALRTEEAEMVRGHTQQARSVAGTLYKEDTECPEL